MTAFILLSPKLFDVKPEHWAGGSVHLLYVNEGTRGPAVRVSPALAETNRPRAELCSGASKGGPFYPELPMGRNTATFCANTNDRSLEVWSWIQCFKLFIHNVHTRAALLFPTSSTLSTFINLKQKFAHVQWGSWFHARSFWRGVKEKHPRLFPCHI